MGKDILNVAEVQDCHVLTILNEKLKGMNYLPYLLLGTDTHTGQNVGLLTRIDPSTDILRTGASVPYPIPSSTCEYPLPSFSFVFLSHPSSLNPKKEFRWSLSYHILKSSSFHVQSIFTRSKTKKL
eukprot:Phypoly_transcript_13992.p1 GENE.Phypoly_transcript_13992~~Phypoly_transcript_13992.p1  ORF type:complete len:126 (+),score=9.27 Phypoly_transcript_13992:156-533(+)